MKNKELLPCPFCGGEADWTPVSNYEIFFVYCTNCGSKVDAYHTIADAIKAWNTRTNTIPVGNGKNYEVTHNG